MQAIVRHPVEPEIDGEAGFKNRPALAFPKMNGARDLSPGSHPGGGRANWPFEPCRLDVATGRVA